MNAPKSGQADHKAARAYANRLLKPICSGEVVLVNLARAYIEQSPGAPAVDAQPVALTFDAFRAANVARCLKWHPAGIQSWSPSDWLTAVTGELGELASLLKMRNRERDGLPGNKFSPSDKQVADEIADVLTYLDLLAAALGIDLGSAAVEKFNEVSVRVGFPDRILLSDPPTPPETAVDAQPVAEWHTFRGIVGVTIFPTNLAMMKQQEKGKLYAAPPAPPDDSLKARLTECERELAEVRTDYMRADAREFTATRRAEAAEARLVELEYKLLIQTESAKQLGRLVAEKDDDRLFFRDRCASIAQAERNHVVDEFLKYGILGSELEKKLRNLPTLGKEPDQTPADRGLGLTRNGEVVR